MALAQTHTGAEIVRLLEQGTACHRTGDLDGAIKAYRKALRSQPQNPDGLHLLGLALWQKGNAGDGVKSILKAIEVRDDFPDAHMNAAIIYVKAGERARAEHHVRRALHFRPGMANAHHILGTLLNDKRELREAAEAFRAALRTDPRQIDSYVELARALRTLGDIDGVAATLAAGLAIAPNHPTLRVFAAEVEFSRGQLRDAWQNYRYRFQSIENRVTAKNYALPQWEGSDLSGKSILIWTEQAPGDEIMYANMIPDIVAVAKRCVIQCSPRLASLFRRSFPQAEVFDRDLTVEELAGINVQSAIGNLGIWLRPTFDTFPSQRGYLKPDTDLRDRLRAKYRSHNRLLVGIAWRSANAESAADKSLNILEWGPVLNVPGVTFVNLQYGDCRAELEAVARGFGTSVIQDAEIDPLRDMDSYTAQVAAMDFVVSSSNTAAHVAGALGVPTACMLPRTIGRGRRWYWFSEQARCPWYPSLTPYVQRSDDTWLDVLRDAGLALLDAVVAHGAATAEGYLASMAMAFARMGRGSDGEILLNRLKALPGHTAQALHTIGNIRKEQGDLDGALQFFDQAALADRSYWPAFNEGGLARASQGRFEDAIETYRAGLEGSPTSPQLLHNLATSLRKLGYSAEAVQYLQRALADTSADASVRDAIELNYAGALDDDGRPEDALLVLDAIIARTPGNVDAHYNRAQALLSIGRFPEGWREMAWRARRPQANVRYDAFAPPRWDGEDLVGKRLLIWTEQGIGDEIVAASMIPDALAVAKHVAVLCSERLVPLFRRSFPEAQIEQRKEPLPKSITSGKFDFQMSLAELGAAFRTSFDGFPRRTNYLAADRARSDALRRKYTAVRPDAPVIGLCWSSLKNYEIGWLKSVNLGAWTPILTTPNVTFVSLQYGDRWAAEISRIRDQLGVDIIQDSEIDPLTNMDDFAAQTAAMDLVISISNTTVHTAAALGVPVWVLLAMGRGRLWYWFHNRTDSPWYASARLFRQERSREWEGVIRSCAAELQNWLGH
jgi:tetratricopeptide (TPR) repeat protein